MTKTLVEFMVPSVFVDEGQYEVSLNGNVAKVSVSFIQNREVMNRITGTQSVGKATMTPDTHGIANISKVAIELPYGQDRLSEQIPGASIVSMLSMMRTVKLECILVLNRLIEVVRAATNRYWITSFSERDILGYTAKVVGDDGKGWELFSLDYGQGLAPPLPLMTLEQPVVASQIAKALKEEREVPFDHTLILDSFNYFMTRRFNEAVILLNTALEVSIANYLVSKLIQDGASLEEATRKVRTIFGKRLHRVMKKHFKEVDGRSLESDAELWKRFNRARYMRANAMHSHARKLTEQEARDAMQDIAEVMQWVLQGNTSLGF